MDARSFSAKSEFAVDSRSTQIKLAIVAAIAMIIADGKTLAGRGT